MKMTEKDILRLFLARRENYAVTSLAHLKGRVYTLVMNGEHYKAVMLQNSFQFYEKRYHVARDVPSLVICYEHNTVLPVAVLSLRAGNYAQPYELPAEISDVEAQRFSKTGSQVLLGMYMCGVKSAQTLINTHLPPTTRQRYLTRAKALGKRTRGKPVGNLPVQATS
ncbi:hypothetical protein [Dictyobacter aurantiacus]|uniref:Uncharacterized protein n=1 Tax=Dictyobacter aurantiacus TaxID=1936993 RepID=A0A401ZD56_9CHLR|nr:hypothetical protein [Dictyobacter aurantiacus]GCE04782.1 hypothetical protein KDAU_21110 [Dictyobacter aurantiacus]